MTLPRRSSRWLALLVSAALALPWAGPVYALRASSESAHAGLEQALHVFGERAGLEETPIDAAAASRIVRGWNQLSEAEQSVVLQELADHRVTQERHAHLAALAAAEVPAGTGTFLRFPPFLDGRATGKDAAGLFQQGARRDVRQRQWVIIAAAGEGSRLLNDAVRDGLLPAPPPGHSILEFYSKPTVPVMPVTGKSPLQVQLETFAADAATYDVREPVTIVVHEEAGRLVRELLRTHRNFGLTAVRTAIQSMNPALEPETGRIVLRDDHHVSFNPDGTGGVVQAAVRSARDADWRDILGADAQVLLSYGDMLLDDDILQRMIGASAETPFVGVGYPYPMERDGKRPEEFRFKFGVPVLVDRGGVQRIEIVEYKEWQTIAGLPEAIAAEERNALASQSYQVLGNSGLYVFPLAGLRDRVAALDQQEHVQRQKDAIGVTGLKVYKVEKFATDLAAGHDPAQMGFVAVDPEVLVPIKDAQALAEVRALAIRRERVRATALGVWSSEMHDEARWEFHPSRTRQGRVSVGPRVSVADPVGIYVAEDRIRVYTHPQPGKPWEPFDPAQFYEAFQVEHPDDPIRIPAGTIFTKDGLRSVPTDAGLEEHGTALLTPGGLKTVFDYRQLADPGSLWRPTTRWQALLKDARGTSYLQRLYGGDSTLIEDRRAAYLRTIEQYEREFGAGEVLIFRVPGRVLWLGGQSDRPGSEGPGNRFTVNGRELLMVVGRKPAGDSKVELRTTPGNTRRITSRGTDFSGYRVSGFDLAELFARYPGQLSAITAIAPNDPSSWDRVAARMHNERFSRQTGKTPDEFLAGVAYLLHDALPSAFTQGFRAAIESNIPTSVGMASSSALATAFAMALTAVNRVELVEQDPVPARRQMRFADWVERTGYGEWVSMSRGPAQDHWTIVSGRPGGISHVGQTGLLAQFELPAGIAALLVNTPPRPWSADDVNSSRTAAYLRGLHYLQQSGVWSRPSTLAEIVMDRHATDKEILEAVRDHIPEGDQEARKTTLAQLADIRRSQRMRQLLEDGTSGTFERIRQLLFLMTKAYQEQLRITDFGDNRAAWHREITDAVLAEVIASQTPLEYLATVGSYGVSSEEMDRMLFALQTALGDGWEHVAPILQGVGGGGTVLIFVDTTRPGLLDRVQAFCQEYAAHHFSEEVRDIEPFVVTPGRGAEALDPAVVEDRLEERGWAQEMVGELFGMLDGKDMRARVHVIAPSVVERYKTLAGFVGRSPFVVIPPNQMKGLKTDEAVADALARETPAETTHVTFYGRADEHRAFVKALARAGRSLEPSDVLLKSLPDNPEDLDILELLPHMMAEIGVSGFEGRWRKFKDALDTLAQQY